MTETSASFGSDRLARRLSAPLLVTAAVTLCTVGAVAVAWEGKPTWPFLGGVAVAFLAVAVVSRRTLSGARAAAGPQPITPATWVTFARAWLCIAFAGFLFTAPPGGATLWVPAGLFGLAAGLDAVDGALARRTDTVSELGGRLDTEIDALLVAVGVAVAVVEGTAPLVFLAVGIARYAFVAGSRWRRARGLPVAELPPSEFRRVTGATIMVTVLIALAPIPGATVSRWVAGAVSVPVLLHFAWDWLVVSGRVDR